MKILVLRVGAVPGGWGSSFERNLSWFADTCNVILQLILIKLTLRIKLYVL
jgi:hypothetical protein